MRMMIWLISLTRSGLDVRAPRAFGDTMLILHMNVRNDADITAVWSQR